MTLSNNEKQANYSALVEGMTPEQRFEHFRHRFPDMPEDELRRMAEADTPRTITQAEDPASVLLNDGYTSSTTVYDKNCYICNDPEFSQMGLPLCKPCPKCSALAEKDAGHVPADDSVCTECGFDYYDEEPEL